MGRCCSLFTRSTCRNPLQIAPTTTGLPYTYSTPYPMLTFIYNIYYCHHRHVALSLLPFPLYQYPYEHSVYPLNWSCLYHVFTTGCLYIYYVHLTNAGYVQHLLFPFSFCHTTLPMPLSYLHSADLTQTCFSCCHCACTKGVQALDSVKRLETIVLLWRYINKIELN